MQPISFITLLRPSAMSFYVPKIHYYRCLFERFPIGRQGEMCLLRSTTEQAEHFGSAEKPEHIIGLARFQLFRIPANKS
ncbi:hypothetical protein CEXT_176771 [Caerostris extrusa]|uniref:Ycf15 n=1 Tax=Caerostris extrusa TaxID=172846 RepID=A0AAV4QMY6_CAEEX|nr:hypothetical protein CEXT_176771 [Caerostris extrusa]